ncbi:glycosyl transferase [Duganella sp. Leaf126]|uniref:glycosyltransferase n=1 Tax=Duganella sp. Leaf126 TaxID=1736266 RepID=UPI0006F39A1D|nr:glycosyltransferase family A protein [Duganella sp. Leaf126]KQQ45124.1 glycosyl transferase [Duganella sp. Leaf126]
MIGIVIPAHDEERYLAACLAAVSQAACHAGLRGESVCVAVVLDHCRDNSRAIAMAHAGGLHGAAYRVDVLEVDVRNVGAARAAGAECLLAYGARWLAFTDADTVVAPDWLVAQLRLGVEVVCGTVAVDDWSAHHEQPLLLSRHFDAAYTDCDGHRHIHGANLGVCALAYRTAGGFAPLACSEDVALVRALERCGASFAWSAAPRVKTSARSDARARGGFGDTLLQYAAAAMLAPAVA